MKYVVLSTPDAGKFIFLAGQKNLRHKIIELDNSGQEYSAHFINNKKSFNKYLKQEKQLCM